MYLFGSLVTNLWKQKLGDKLYFLIKPMFSDEVLPMKIFERIMEDITVEVSLLLFRESESITLISLINVEVGINVEGVQKMQNH